MGRLILVLSSSLNEANGRDVYDSDDLQSKLDDPDYFGPVRFTGDLKALENARGEETLMLLLEFQPIIPKKLKVCTQHEI